MQIGEQCWFAENLRATKFKNGDEIAGNLSPSEWENAGASNLAARRLASEDSSCESNNWSPSINGCDSLESVAEFGFFYNMYAMQDERGICPSGFHVPTIQDFEFLMQDSLGNSISAENLKSTYGWYTTEEEGVNGNDVLGFSGMPAGFVTQTGGSTNMGLGDTGGQILFHSQYLILGTSTMSVLVGILES